MTIDNEQHVTSYLGACFFVMTKYLYNLRIKLYTHEINRLNFSEKSDAKRAFYRSNRKAMNRNWSNQKPNPALKTKTVNI